MTLHEAIKHCEEVAQDNINRANILWDSKEKARCEDCAEEHRQLAEWLKDYKRLTDMLAKIRAEIEQLTYYWCEVNPNSVIDDVLQIIDKYKTESEDKE